ncbi:acyltransferase family protein [Hymenobacter terrestris]|uniref:Acyltransferase n=1 Tax=Hymenobacter terrestris TaxID=2748310 RepID=A0ABX2Q0X2_9BACT|nr:acyltransferase [Hymenobacter terrestris]NVO84588.1 acyltransferase [Hymenobacter terrestris]
MTAPTYLPALTGFRAVAAFLVFLFHYRTAWAWLPDWIQGPWLALSSQLNLGVSLFFTLSGFLLFRQYHQSSWPGSWVFFSRRLARIYPLLFLLTTIIFLFGQPMRTFQPERWWTEYLFSITLLKGFSEQYQLTGIGAAWSLTVEESFYLFLPLLIWFSHQYKVVWWWALAGLLLVLGLGLSYLLRPWGWLETVHFTMLGTFFGRAAEFMIGAAFARLPAGRLPYATYIGLTLLVFGTGLLIVVAHIYGVAAGIQHLAGVAINNWLLPWGTGLLLYGLATQPTRLSRLLSSRPACILGRSSYAFYLIHLGVFSDFIQGHLHRDLPWLPPVLTLLILLIVGAVALHYLVEKPLHYALLRMLRAN